jgi:hypothetical protein
LGNWSQILQATNTPAKAILRIKPAKCIDHLIKVTFNDNNDLEIKEMCFTFPNWNPT